MDRTWLKYGCVLIMITGHVCVPVLRAMWDCDEVLNCTENSVPVCGSDGQTYKNKCHLKLEFQIRYCQVGDFNPVIFVHDGPCTEDSYDVDIFIESNISY